ncbi:MAG: carboxypeptidase regulatory-like domain-containing protein, partial [Planctomycetes bacterium]|nr:carboxypeptidase regulatory-like domain-containing protein [Planctomycetota bacterium]
MSRRAMGHARGRAWVALSLVLGLGLLTGLWWLGPGELDGSYLQPEKQKTGEVRGTGETDLVGAGASTTFRSGGVDVVEGEDPAVIDWQGAETRPWRGVVLSTRGALPLSGSQVAFVCEAGRMQTETDGQGEFEFQAPSGVVGTLSAWCEGYQRRSRPNVTAGQDAPLFLTASASIAGTFDGDPEGVTAKLFHMEQEHNERAIQSVELSLDGSFHFEDLAAGSYSISLGPHIYSVLKDLAVNSGDELNVRMLAVEEAQRVKGIVVRKPGGEPVPNCQLEVRFHTLGVPTFLEEPSCFRGKTNGDGRFEVSLGAGVRTSLHCMTPWGGETLIPYVDPTEYGSGKELRIEVNAPARLAGRVVDPEGKPIARLELDLRKVSGAGRGRQRVPEALSTFFAWQIGIDHAVTDDEGRFEFAEVPALEGLLLTESAPKGVGEIPSPDELGFFKLKPGEVKDNVELTLGRTIRLTGRVLDLDGIPYGGVEVRCIDKFGDPKGIAVSDGAGGYALEGLNYLAKGVAIELRADRVQLAREFVKWKQLEPDG